VHRLKELLRLGQVLQDVRANDQVILTQGSDVIAVQVNPTEWRAGNLRLQTLTFVRERNVAAPFHKLSPKNSVPAAEIQRTRLRPKRNAAPLNPFDGILSLKGVKRRIVTVFEVPGYESMNDHIGLMLRGVGFSSKPIPTPNLKPSRLGGTSGVRNSPSDEELADKAGGNHDACRMEGRGRVMAWRWTKLQEESRPASNVDCPLWTSHKDASDACF
jgi:hypothetical protein